MNLEALLEPLPERGAPRPCKTARIIAGLEEPYRSALQKLVDLSFANGGLSDAALRDRMLKAGLDVATSNIHYHRRGICSCKAGN